MNEYAAQLWSAADAALPRWVRRSVTHLLDAAGVARTAEVEARIDATANAARVEVGGELRAFLELDVDEQRTNPLAVLRRGVRFPTALLADLGVPHVVRGEFEERTFPDDVYGLAPATWRDVDESLHEPGIVWGAWKAKTVLDRRRAEGRR